jgi:alpha-ketoglutarate-dependent 2,4-dichlorophenoxyacetate dioxygenase
LWHSRRLAAPDCEYLKDIDPQKHFMTHHALVQLHEPSGRMNLHIVHAHMLTTSMTYRKRKDRISFERCLAHATQDKYAFEVEWENNGDIIIWVRMNLTSQTFITC